MQKLILLALGLFTAALAVIGFYLMWSNDHQGATVPYIPASQASETKFTAPFTLTNQNGKTVTQATFLGKPTLYFFGFTHCPDICPTTLGTLTTWLNTLGTDASKLNIVFISIDPERDTPASLKQYLSGFHPQITGATGTPDQLKAMAKEFMVYYAKVPQPTPQNPNDYTMSHSSMILMADKTGTFMGSLDAHTSDADAVSQLKTLIK